MEKAMEFQKNIYFCFIDYTKTFDCVDHNKLENSWRDRSTTNINYLLGNLYMGQEATVSMGQWTMDWFNGEKGIWQGCILSPCLFNLHTVYTLRNARLEESQAEIKISGRNINKLRYAGDITLMVESEEELKNLLRRVKEKGEREEWKSWLESQH